MPSSCSASPGLFRKGALAPSAEVVQERGRCTFRRRTVTIFNETFSAAQVCEAAGITTSTLQTWIKRDLIIGHSIEKPGQAGIRRQFSFFNVMEIAVAAECVRGKLDLRVAFQAAAGFSHAGHNRLPGIPFRAEGRTLIAVGGGRSDELIWRPNEDVYAAARGRLGRPGAITFVDASAIFDRVVASLGRHPEEVMESVYAAAGRAT